MHRRIYMKAEVETVEKDTMEENDDYDKFEIVVLVRKDQEGEEVEIEEEEEKQEEKPVEKKPVVLCQDLAQNKMRSSAN